MVGARVERKYLESLVTLVENYVFCLIRVLLSFYSGGIHNVLETKQRWRSLGQNLQITTEVFQQTNKDNVFLSLFKYVFGTPVLLFPFTKESKLALSASIYF